jgi:thiol-disulfide isomerase/thioredoxin
MAAEAVAVLTVYSRQHCGLCEDMIDELERLRSEYLFKFDVIDVDGDVELVRRYGDAVPVLASDGRELCRHRLDRKAVTAFLSKIR